MLCLRETLTYSPEYRKTKEEFFKIFQFQATFLGPELFKKVKFQAQEIFKKLEKYYIYFLGDQSWRYLTDIWNF